MVLGKGTFFVVFKLSKLVLLKLDEDASIFIWSYIPFVVLSCGSSCYDSIVSLSIYQHFKTVVVSNFLQSGPHLVWSDHFWHWMLPNYFKGNQVQKGQELYVCCQP